MIGQALIASDNSHRLGFLLWVCPKPSFVIMQYFMALCSILVYDKWACHVQCGYIVHYIIYVNSMT